MSASRVMVLVAVASLVSGCAGVKTRQELSRLQSQVGLLDERVAQLERTGVGGGLSSESLSESMIETGTTVGGTSVSSHGPSPSKKFSTASSLKPSTREIQQALKNAGFYQGSVDGKMGSMTRDAVKEFQRIHGLNDDGVVGRQTWAKLKAYADLSAGSGELSAAEILK